MPGDDAPGRIDPDRDFHEIETVLHEQKKSRGPLIGNYLILEKLGEGGMGAVFKARDRRSKRLVAVKILPPWVARDSDVLAQFRREVEAAGRLNHPNVVAAIACDEDRGVHFVVMDHVEGLDLDRVVSDRGPMAVDQAVDCLLQAARGLEAAHARGIIHRDIKPGNLILDTAGTVRVLDLGLACIVDASNRFNKTAAGGLTQTGVDMGTVDFRAPEQAEDPHRVDRRADIYSLGCTLYFLLTGRVPFPGETILKRSMAHREREAPAISASRSGVPMALETCYKKMMAKRPADRPASMTEVIALLQASKVPPDDVGRRVAPPPSTPMLSVDDETPPERAGPPKTNVEPSIFARREEREGVPVNRALNLEDLVMDLRLDRPRAGARMTPMPSEPLERTPTWAFEAHSRSAGAAVVALAAAVLLMAGFVAFWLSRPRPSPDAPESPTHAPHADAGTPDVANPAVVTPRAQPVRQVTTIYDGSSGQGWMLCNRAPLPPQSLQPDGLNPHGTGSYLVVYNRKLGDFILDFDYKLTPGCNSGVFLRVTDLNDPVQTGIEVALDDTRHGDERDSGAFYGLVAPTTHPQRPSGQWNHMTITAQGPRLTVSLNETEVSSIDLDQWTIAGKRPDGGDHIFKNRALASLARSGYLGFQDLGGNCWYRNVIVTTDKRGARASNLSGRRPAVG